jgi:2-(1,2-epoxy-1,2-dihydrophenyl)acetyl-CoA isomerase
MNESICVERNGYVAVLTLNAPAKRNAISTEMRTQLRDHLQTLDADDSCRAILLTGVGGNFCAGGDISEMTSDPERGMARVQVLHEVVRQIAAGRKPVIAAVEGSAAGAGLSLVCACDYVVAAAGARFVAAFVKLGLYADCGLAFTLANRVGRSRAHRIILGAETISAEAALEIGLADDLVPSGNALMAATKIAQAYAALAPLAVAAAKAVNATTIATLDAALALDGTIQVQLSASADHHEAKAAFFEKRAPHFKGL